MKKLYICIIALSTLFIFSACNDEWKDELYTQMVSLKAPIDYQDVSRVYLRYTQNGDTTYQLPVLLSGSKLNKKDIDVHIAVDNDTLAILNEAKYIHRTDLYYKQLEPSFYELPSSTCRIPAGSNKALFDVKFKFSGLDLVEKWVLPLTIVENPSYSMNMYKGWRKALLYILLFNDFSGEYASTNMKVFFGDENSNSATAAKRTARVVDERSVFFYAGITEEASEERGGYKIIATFDPQDEVISDIEVVILGGAKVVLQKRKGKLKLRAENSAINFSTISDATYEISEIMDDEKPYLKKRNITMNMEYRYTDITSASVDLPYRCTGSMAMQRIIDTRLPIGYQDQGIIW